MGRSRRNKNRRKHLRTKRKNKRQIVQRGGSYPKYGREPLEIHPVLDNILKQNIILKPHGNIFTPDHFGSNSSHQTSYDHKKSLYLLGYEDFIADHSLIPLYNGPITILIDNKREPEEIKQVYYYLSPFVREYFIKPNEYLFHGSSSQGTPQLSKYVGYNGVKPSETFLKFDNIHYSLHASIHHPPPKHFSDFLYFPRHIVKGHERDRLPIQRYITYDFIPDSDKPQVKRVEGIGDVILQKPPNDEPWTGELIRILFEPDFVPPPIIKSEGAVEDIPLQAMTSKSSPRYPPLSSAQLLMSDTSDPDILINKLRGQIGTILGSTPKP